MLSDEDFAGLQIGDLVEATALFSGLSDEPVVLRVTERTADRLDFIVAYYGVTLGKWACQQTGEGMAWTFK
jgi:hypothetical protein